MIIPELITFLLDKTSAVKNVFAERPSIIPSEYILVEQTGSMRDNFITTSTITIQCISDSMQGGSLLQAMILNDEVKDALLGDSTSYGLVEEPEIISIELNSDYNFTDTETSEYRYQAVYVITHY
jgi:hypothetical protein